MAKLFLKVGNIVGSVSGGGHAGWSNVESFSWGPGSGSSLLKSDSVSLKQSSFVIGKALDSATPHLAHMAASGKPADRVCLELMHETHADRLLLRFVFKSVLISGYSASGGSVENLPMETVSFEFEDGQLYYGYTQGKAASTQRANLGRRTP